MRDRQKRQYIIVAVAVIAVVIVAFMVSRGGSRSQQGSSQQTTRTEQDGTKLAKLVYHSNDNPVVEVNHNKSTLNPDDWKSNHVVYSNLDDLNRTSTANIAYIEKRNVANGSLRVRQYVQPAGWHQKMDHGEAIINRGHLIAYSLSGGIDQDGSYEPNNQSGDQNNPKNLFTQSAFSNQQLQTVYETKVRNALRQNKQVIYKAQAIFDGDNLMANGVQLQAISTDRSLNFNVFIFNVQPGYKFDYATGRSTVDREMKVPSPDQNEW